MGVCDSHGENRTAAGHALDTLVVVVNGRGESRASRSMRVPSLRLLELVVVDGIETSDDRSGQIFVIGIDTFIENGDANRRVALLKIPGLSGMRDVQCVLFDREWIVLR